MELKGKSVAVVGCGWLGLPLAQHLVALGANVLGSKTTEAGVKDAKKRGVDCRLFLLNPEPVGAKYELLFDVDWLVLNIPPARSEDVEIFHFKQMKEVFNLAKKGKVKNIIFISSTSVYPNLNRVVYEEDNFEPDKNSGKVLKKVEGLFLNEPQFKTTVIRFGGLIGKDRLPGRFLAGKTGLKNGEAPVNLIHIDDCIKIITEVIQQEVTGEIFNACAPFHPTRKTFYEEAARKEGFGLPEFAIEKTFRFKEVNSDKLMNKLNYQFSYKSPMDAL